MFDLGRQEYKLIVGTLSTTQKVSGKHVVYLPLVYRLSIRRIIIHNVPSSAFHIYMSMSIPKISISLQIRSQLHTLSLIKNAPYTHGTHKSFVRRPETPSSHYAYRHDDGGGDSEGQAKARQAARGRGRVTGAALRIYPSDVETEVPGANVGKLAVAVEEDDVRADVGNLGAERAKVGVAGDVVLAVEPGCGLGVEALSFWDVAVRVGVLGDPYVDVRPAIDLAC
jgi:hypothetical protein